MRKFRKYLSIFILISLIIGNITIVYGAESDDIKDIRRKAYDLGYEDGEIEGEKNDKGTPYYWVMPSYYEIIERFKKEYKKDYDPKYDYIIVLNYEYGFEEGYNSTLRDDKDEEENLNYPETLGRTLGEIYAYRDFYDGKKPNWSKAIPTDRKLIRMYNLDRENSTYKSLFIELFTESFKEGYEEIYEKASFEPFKISYDQGISDGEHFGNVLGTIYGSKDYFDGRSIDYKRNMPSDTVIEREYSLNKDEDEYREGFLAGFKRAYEESYNQTFRNININEHKMTYEQGYEHGKTAGSKKGEVYATKDYYLKYDNNWRRHETSPYNIINEYNLLLEIEKYRDGFISGFNEGLSEGYTTTFQKLNNEVISDRVTVETIPISGGEVYSLDNIMSIRIDEGIYYNPIVVSINILPDKFTYILNNYIKASDFYSIDILNKSFELDDDQDIELKFEYYGKENGGIYKFVNNQWVYLPSTFENNYIKTNLKPSSLSQGENIYAVLIDKNAIVLPDIRGNWAKEEINAFVRRGIVSGYPDRTFKPDRKVSRGEFLTMLSKTYGWETQFTTYNIHIFKDNNSFGAYANDIGYCVGMGYINGYPDKTFKPNKYITYKEVEIIMQRVLYNNNFRWNNISSNALYNKDYRSKSYNSMDNNITRAEAVYMLYVLNEQRY